MINHHLKWWLLTNLCIVGEQGKKVIEKCGVGQIKEIGEV